MRSSAPHGAHCVNDILCRKLVAARSDCFARRAAAMPLELLEKAWTRSAMNGSVHAATTAQRFVRGIDDRVDVQRRDVGGDDLDHRSPAVILRSAATKDLLF